MVGLESGRPAGVVGWQVHEECAALRVYRVGKLAELVERRGVRVELRACGIDGEEVRCGKRAAVAAHARERGRHREDWQELDDAKAHVVHDVPKLASDVAERTRWRDDAVALGIEEVLRLPHARLVLGVEKTRSAELAWEDGVDRVGAASGCGRHLHAHVAAMRPFRLVLALREEARLSGEDADGIQLHDAGERAWGGLGHRHVVPRAAKVGAEHGPPRAPGVQPQRDGKLVALPAK